jgi:SDR family mycofactocin-dependent oxidoreductase
MGLLDGRVALVTGAARGQGRSHAFRLAREGADVIALDVCARVSASTGYPPADRADLEETGRLVAAEGARVVAREVDVRDSAALDGVLGEAVPALGGRLDVVVANAGIADSRRFWEMPDEQWKTVIDVNLTGVWRTLKAAVPFMLAAGQGGSIITISSVAGIKSLPAAAHYSAAKHGVVGLTKAAAIELGEYGIRVNSVHPWGVETPMAGDRSAAPLFAEHPAYRASYAALLPGVPIARSDDISDAVLWLASDLSRAVTGAQLSVDMGATTV